MNPATVWTCFPSAIALSHVVDRTLADVASMTVYQRGAIFASVVSGRFRPNGSLVTPGRICVLASRVRPHTAAGGASPPTGA